MILFALLLSGCACARLASVRAERTDIISPSFGDVKLEAVPGKPKSKTQGRLLIYFTDGGSRGEWGSISSHYDNKLREFSNIAIAACNMLGYEEAETTEEFADSIETSYRVWWYNVSCPEGATNLLQCDYAVCNSITRTEAQQIGHDLDFFITCKAPNSEYSGMVKLCPPDQLPAFNATNPIHQISFGLVKIRRKGAWGILNDDGKDSIIDIETHEADSICRQMGYTQAVLGSALHAKTVKDQYNFSDCRKSATKWKASDIECRHGLATKPCLTCCITENLVRCDTKCFDDNDIVLRCVSDIFSRTFPETGSRSACEFPNPSHCAEASNEVCMSKDNFGVLVGLPIAGMVTCVVVALVVVIKCWRQIDQRCCHGYQIIGQPNGDAALQPVHGGAGPQQDHGGAAEQPHDGADRHDQP